MDRLHESHLDKKMFDLIGRNVGGYLGLMTHAAHTVGHCTHYFVGKSWTWFLRTTFTVLNCAPKRLEFNRD